MVTRTNAWVRYVYAFLHARALNKQAADKCRLCSSFSNWSKDKVEQLTRKHPKIKITMSNNSQYIYRSKRTGGLSSHVHRTREITPECPYQCTTVKWLHKLSLTTETGKQHFLQNNINCWFQFSVHPWYADMLQALWFKKFLDNHR